VFKVPPLATSATVTVDGVWSKIVGVKLFRGIDVGGVVPTGAIVTSGEMILIMVPGVDAGIEAELAGIN
tara:strand:+ start:1875 stop:2081 length:207 start_codon:yes stop_codon:yes gene_type:complete